MAKPQAAVGKKAKAVAVVLPEWMPTDLWQEILDHRKTMKCPNTQVALGDLLEDLEIHREQGQDIHAMLKQSRHKGWKGLFPVRQQPALRVVDNHATPHTTRSAEYHQEMAHATVGKF